VIIVRTIKGQYLRHKTTLLHHHHTLANALILSTFMLGNGIRYLVNLDIQQPLCCSYGYYGTNVANQRGNIGLLYCVKGIDYVTDSVT
jgi:hypothetical protein